MARFAADTTVSPEKSRGEIERTLTRYGAEKFMYGWDKENAVIQFELETRLIKFVLPLPDREGREFTHTPSRGYKRDPGDVMKEWEKAVRQKWRALNLVIKAKLEAVESEITTFDSEFLAHIILPNGKTVGEYVIPTVESVYLTGKMSDQKLLPFSTDD